MHFEYSEAMVRTSSRAAPTLMGSPSRLKAALTDVLVDFELDFDLQSSLCEVELTSVPQTIDPVAAVPADSEVLRDHSFDAERVTLDFKLCLQVPVLATHAIFH
jgi:hypothetical protein